MSVGLMSNTTKACLFRSGCDSERMRLLIAFVAVVMLAHSESRASTDQRRRRSQLGEVKAMLKRELQKFENGSFGEFIKGENAVSGDKVT